MAHSGRSRDRMAGEDTALLDAIARVIDAEAA
jgi:hypothetical protein